MPSLPLGRSAFERTRGALPRLPVVNFIVEKAPTEKEGGIFQSRRGMVENMTVGSGPIHATMQRDGILSGARITVSGSEVYSDTTLIGSINVVGPVSIAADATQVVITGGADAVHWDGSTFSTIAFPDGAAVRAVAYLAGYFLAVRDDTQRIYFSAVGDGTDWDGLDYFSAENEPDRLLDLLVVGDGLVPVGTRTTEFHVKTGDADLPFQPIQQRVFEYGAIATGCSVPADNTHFWIGDDGIVYRAGQVPEPVSDDGHTADILASTSWRAYLTLDERHKLLHVRLDTKTLVFDITQNGAASEFASIGRANYRGYCADRTIIGDDDTGTLWELIGYLDDGGPMERRIAGGFPIEGGAFGVDVLRMRIEVGQGDLVGDYIEPTLEMRFSDDLGKTWSSWEGESLGEQGDYRTMPEWRALGMFDYPGALFEFRFTDPLPLRISGAEINPPGGGRSR
jgi:hypothetical protein